MTKTITAGLVALALAGGTLAVAPAKADTVSTTVTTTTVPAYGYQDGYWDRGHAWHTWATPEASVQFRKTYTKHYYSGPHTGYPEGGWRSDTWWETH